MLGMGFVVVLLMGMGEGSLCKGKKRKGEERGLCLGELKVGRMGMLV